MIKKVIMFGLIIVSLQSNAQNRTVESESSQSPMRSFLMTCAYGFGIGAAVGLTSLLFTEDPSSHLNQIAKGASLGLYVGMAIGAYKANHPTKSKSSDSDLGYLPKVIIQPTFSNTKLDGGQVSVTAFRF